MAHDGTQRGGPGALESITQREGRQLLQDICGLWEHVRGVSTIQYDNNSNPIIRARGVESHVGQHVAKKQGDIRNEAFKKLPGSDHDMSHNITHVQVMQDALKKQIRKHHFFF